MLMMDSSLSYISTRVNQFVFFLMIMIFIKVEEDARIERNAQSFVSSGTYIEENEKGDVFQNFGEIMKNLGEIVRNLAETKRRLVFPLVETAGRTVTEFAESGVVEKVSSVLGQIIKVKLEIIRTLFSIIPAIVEKFGEVPRTIQSVIDTKLKILGPVLDTARSATSAVVESASGAVTDVVIPAVKTKTKLVTGVISKAPEAIDRAGDSAKATANIIRFGICNLICPLQEDSECRKENCVDDVVDDELIYDYDGDYVGANDENVEIIGADPN